MKKQSETSSYRLFHGYQTITITIRAYDSAILGDNALFDVKFEDTGGEGARLLLLQPILTRETRRYLKRLERGVLSAIKKEKEKDKK